MANDAIKDYIKFNVLGSETNVSDEDKETLESLLKRKLFCERNLKKNGRQAYIIEKDFGPETQARILNLKERKDIEITFRNDVGRLCVIDKAYVKNGYKVLFDWHFEIYPKRTYTMTLERFLDIYSLKEFKQVKPKEFKEIYLKTMCEELQDVENSIKELQNKYNDIYKKEKDDLHKEYVKELSKFDKLEKEAKSKKRELKHSEALDVAKKFKGIEVTKDYWNSNLADSERAMLMGWISKHIYSIRIYGLISGQSGNTLGTTYADIGNVKLRDPEYNEEGKLTSQDSIVAHISFKHIENAPINLLKKVCSSKNRQESLFYANRLNDKNLALFLLAEYSKYGFKAGTSKLSELINVEELKKNEFSAFEESFNAGFNL